MRKHLFSFILLLLTVSTFGQITISGIITDHNGEPLIGAAIKVKETSKYGTTTNIDGTYSLLVPDSTITLLYTYTGFKDLEYSLAKIKSRSEKSGKGYVHDVVFKKGYYTYFHGVEIGALADIKNKIAGLSTELHLHYSLGFEPRIHLSLDNNFNDIQKLVDLKIRRYDIIRHPEYHVGMAYKYRSFIIPETNFDSRQNIYGIETFYKRDYFYLGYITESVRKNISNSERSVQHGINIEYMRPIDFGAYLFDLRLDFSILNSDEYYTVGISRELKFGTVGLKWRDVNLYKSIELAFRYRFWL